MDPILKNKITEILQSPKILEIINDTDFYFQKAKDALQDFLLLEVSEEAKKFLLTNRKEYNELKQLFEDTQEFLEFGKLILTVIAYCDSNAHKKNEFNKYDDKRVLALAFVRMNNWVEQLITYKFEGRLVDGSIKNAVDYLLNPTDNFTMLSENHRSQISENLFKKIYTREIFKNVFLNYFSELYIEALNIENLTHVLSRIAYSIINDWKESVIGLLSPDSTGWQENHINLKEKINYLTVWNHRKPNMPDKTLKLLRGCIEEYGYFRIFYSYNYKVHYVAEVIDFVVNQNQLDKSDWGNNYENINWDGDKFEDYKDESKSASIIYLTNKFYKIAPIPESNFKYYANKKYPTVGSQAPIISFLSNIDLKKLTDMQEYKNLLEYKNQIILQGPPGTGKTREAKLIAKEMLGLVDIEDLKDNDQFKLIQFHPSYTYEDFVRGIIAESKGDKIEYKNVNKTLGLFAEKALKNFRNSKKIPELISKEIWVEENYQKFKENLESILEKSGELMIKEKTKPKIIAIEDDAIRVNRYSNEKDSVLIKDSDIINGYIGLYLVAPVLKVKDNLSLSKSARSGMYYLYQNLIEKFKEYLKEKKLNFEFSKNFKREELQKYILVIDEINRANLSSVLGELIYALEYRGEAVESMYNVDGNELILPPNLYIIGTMNTADRSVGHIDYAIRRRFAFVDVLAKDLSQEEGIDFDSILFNEVNQLFETNLSPEFEKKDVQLGHSYFIDKSHEGGSINLRLEYEIKPILLEYVKDGVLIGKDIKSIIEVLKPSI